MRSFRKNGVFAALILLTVLFFGCLDLVLYPCTYTRNDVHTLATEPRDVLIMGTSTAKMGIDPDALLTGTGLSGHNAAAGGEYPEDAYYLLRLAAEKQKPKLLIFDVDTAYFTTEKEKGNNALLFYHEFPLCRTKLAYFADAVMDSDLRALLFPSYEYPLRTTLSRAADSFSQKIRGDYDPAHLKGTTQEYHANGYIERYPVPPDQFPPVNPKFFSEEALLDENLRDLEKIISFCRANNIMMVAISVPAPDGLTGLNPESFEAGWDYFADWLAAREVPFYNFNTDYYGLFPHDPLQFTDYEGHMNGDSARAYSAVLGKLLDGEGIWEAVRDTQ